MPRPRKFVRIIDQPDGTVALSTKKDKGREIHGLSFNKSNRSYYTIDEATGNREYRGTDVNKAVASVENVNVFGQPQTWTPEFWKEKEKEAAKIDSHVASIKELERLAIQMPHVEVRRLIADGGGSTAPTDEKLSDCLKLWLLIRQEEKGCKTIYHADVERAFNRFKTLVGDLPISQLAAEHFAEWRRWVKKESKKRDSNKWAKDQHKYVATILRGCKEDRPSWRFPDGLLEWAKLPKTEAKKLKYSPAKKNRDPFPKEIFHVVINQCHALASTTTSGMPTTSQSDKAKIGRVKTRNHRGIQLEAMFRIAVNCGFDNADFCGNEDRKGLQWSHLHLEARTPFMDLPRVKTGCERMTPLLPSTVAALQRWRRITTSQGYVFHSEQGNKFRASTVYNQLRDIMDEAKVKNGFTFKHLRNVGSTLARRAKLSLLEIDAFLGHDINGTSRFYVGDVDETYLVSLVDLIGSEYFEGENVTSMRVDEKADGSSLL
jgi:integrase